MENAVRKTWGFPRPSPAMIVALIALFLALGGTGIAAHHYLITSTNQIKPSVLTQLEGKSEPTGTQGGRVAARAFAIVAPICKTCLPPPGYSPLGPHSRNVRLGSPRGAAEGAWCFQLGGGINPSTATVVPSIVGPDEHIGNRFVLETAEWILGAPDCSSQKEIEVRTVGYTEGAGVKPVLSREIHFSFVVP